MRPGTEGLAEPAGGWPGRVVLAMQALYSLGDPGYQLFRLEHHLVGVAALHHLSIDPAGDL